MGPIDPKKRFRQVLVGCNVTKPTIADMQVHGKVASAQYFLGINGGAMGAAIAASDHATISTICTTFLQTDCLQAGRMNPDERNNLAVAAMLMEHLAKDERPWQQKVEGWLM